MNAEEIMGTSDGLGGEPLGSTQIALDTGSPGADRSARYVDWTGEEVEVRVLYDGDPHGIDGSAVIIGEWVEFGGARSVQEALELLREIQAPPEIVSWVRQVAAAAREGRA